MYELVVRHFLACVSQDAKGSETNVKATIDEEHFSLNGLQIIEKNYLDVYPYEKWSAKVIPTYREGETFTPNEIVVSSRLTGRKAQDSPAISTYSVTVVINGQITINLPASPDD